MENNVIDSIINKLLELRESENSIPNKNTSNSVLSDDDIEVEVDAGTPMKIGSKTYYKMIYADINNLKKDTETLLTVYLEEIKPKIMTIEANIKKSESDVKAITDIIHTIQEKQPKSIKTWIEEKGKISESIGNLGKVLIYIILILWIISTAIPQVLDAIKKFMGI